MVLRWFLVHGTTLLSCTMYIALRWFLVQYMALPGLLYMVLRWFLVLWHYAGFLYNVHGTALVSFTMVLRWFLVQGTILYAGFKFSALRMFVLR